MPGLGLILDRVKVRTGRGECYAFKSCMHIFDFQNNFYISLSDDMLTRMKSGAHCNLLYGTEFDS